MKTSNKTSQIIGRTSFVILLAVIVVNPIFSPQFLAWLAPFVAFLTAWEIGIFVTASSMTWLYFKYWEDVVKLQPLATNVLIGRNLVLFILLVISTVILVRDLLKLRK